jgi:hypothetical protein
MYVAFNHGNWVRFPAGGQCGISVNLEILETRSQTEAEMLVRIQHSALKFNKMDDSMRMELFQFLMQNLSISVDMDTEYETYGEYATCNITLSLRNPETGEVEVIGNSYDSASINRD